ncbi:hypothetical protein [Vallitalea guaymasensis]|uniref:hypothetical protein n=1 Tax=Vallitalea guaymasensis TaxID=1185412 RepID=UPI000DE48BA4|nr:hypothetical protein [Vallitalea guaymasensis]
MLDENDLDYIKECMDSVKEEVEEDIIYKQYLTKSGGNKALGQLPAEEYKDIPLTAAVKTLSLDFIQKSNGIYKNGDMEMTIRDIEEPKTKDKILYNNNLYEVKEYSPIHLIETISCKVRCKKID